MKSKFKVGDVVKYTCDEYSQLKNDRLYTIRELITDKPEPAVRLYGFPDESWWWDWRFELCKESALKRLLDIIDNEES